MATATTNFHATDAKQGVLSRFFASFMRGLEAHHRVASRRQAIEKLEAKSDEELAKMGLKRDDIPYYVFRDLFYI
ncbi:MAG: hypothetical protein RIA08_00155 [Roseovarius sp.]|jgi:uncharacterized protein YjiS (DUF1127 family)|uniref:hypothetical protein n=1 Tax=Roseovarius sp. TaxID=1486281 RepID=UPI0007CF76A1|nr:hypothetical protein [Roseovarius sp.]KZY35745.1 hypothetical protein A3731_17045 [Roseovarius sp. HI0049]KZY46734.1 hypothetical protein A3731_31405 [Roseovarius sp. HI0049]MDM8166381.1 hypothetical protein [Roseovarius sp.]